MKIKRLILGGIFILIAVLLITSVSALASRSNPQFINPGVSSSQYLGSIGSSLDPGFSEDQCQDSGDFLIQISPLGCTPSVVRSDLLEEQNVPIFCQLDATKINPLIEVEAVESVSFSNEEYPNGISGIGFHPANAAVRTSQSTLLNSPILNNIGYVVIVLEKNKNESSMPDWIEGNLTANIKYDIKNAFGIGKATYYLPEMTDNEWESQYKSYGFWRGKGFLRAEGIDEDGATIFVYDGEKDVVSSFNLEKGEISNKLYLPGFYCQSSLQVRLDSFENPDTKARIVLDGDVIEVADGEQFLENRCSVRDLERLGLLQWVKITCKGDQKRETFELAISPSIRLSLNGVENNYEIGQQLYKAGKDSVYLIYAGTAERVGSDSSNKGRSVFETDDPEDLVIYTYKSSLDVEKLDDEDIYSLGRTANENLRAITHVLQRVDMESLEYWDEPKKLYGADTPSVDIIGFATPEDKNISDDYRTQFENAKSDYKEILEKYAGEKRDDDDLESFGQKALFNLIQLASETGQKNTTLIYCDEFEQRYSDSFSDVEEFCGTEYENSNSRSSAYHISVNGFDKSISFKGINDPSFENYGATIKIDGVQHTLLKDQRIYLDAEGIQYLQLDRVNDDGSVRLNVLVVQKDTADSILQAIKESATTIGTFGEANKYTRRVTLEENTPDNFGGNFVFELIDTNLEKVAKVTVLPGIDNAGSKADFSFKIGIEKRAIDLSPERIQKKIDGLNKTIEKWTSISDNLGNLVKGFKAACLATGTLLTVKTFWTGLSGKASARQDIMPSWREWCRDNSDDVEQCLVDNNDEINADVEALADARITRDEVNLDEMNEEQFKDVKEGLIIQNEINGKSVDKEGLRNYLNFTNHAYEVREISYYQNLKKSAGENSRLADFADQKLDELWSDVNDEYTRLGAAQVLSDKYSFGATILQTKGVRTVNVPAGQTWGSISDKFTGGPTDSDSKKMYARVVQESGGGAEYLVLYDSSGQIQKTYKITGSSLKDAGKGEDDNPLNIRFNVLDSGSYENKYENPEVVYYETGEFKGRPAIVPISVSDGWYAATRAGGGTLSAFDDSGKVNYFYLCNVMENGRQEFSSGRDECVGINAVTSAVDSNSFEGLSDSEVKSWAKKGIAALNEASSKYKSGLSGQLSILGQKIGIGNPAVSLSGTECTDFMSPEDCRLLYNVCDPVVCPSSRCDFGGTNAVTNVIQSGILGSLILCLPNFPKVWVPVCLSGLKAGIDGLISVYTSYRDCLQENLDTGSTVGMCDEIHSIYLCDFLWRQGLPFSKIVFTKVLEAVLPSVSNTARGGGEYLNVAAAWANAANSVEYMTQYYAKDSFAAFQARSMDQVGTEVCKNFISASYPASGDFFDALIEPDSPYQFHGRFDEIPFTTATVPATSQYKVFYHIYAGQDSGVQYKVYLSSPIGSSYYKDNPTVTVASGYINKGEYATETVDFTAPSGYQQMCINVQGQEECGFKQVSTSAALNYIEDKYLAEQANQRDIDSENECISGSASVYNFLNPNLQAGAEEAINPQLQNRGITRVCSTNQPEKGTDASRWVEVGTCDGDEGVLKCWLDTESVKDVIENTEVESNVLESQAEEYLKKLNEALGQGETYFVGDEFEEKVQEIEEMSENGENEEIISILSEELIKRAFYNHQKAELYLLRGNAYRELAFEFFGIWEEQEIISALEDQASQDFKDECESYSGEVALNPCSAGCGVAMNEYVDGLFCCKVDCVNEATQTFSDECESEGGLVRTDFCIGGCGIAMTEYIDDFVCCDEECEKQSIQDFKDECEIYSGEVALNPCSAGCGVAMNEYVDGLFCCNAECEDSVGKSDDSTTPENIDTIDNSDSSPTGTSSSLAENIPICLDLGPSLSNLNPFGRDKCFLYDGENWYYAVSADSSSDFDKKVLSDNLKDDNYEEGIRGIFGLAQAQDANLIYIYREFDGIKFKIGISSNLDISEGLEVMENRLQVINPNIEESVCKDKTFDTAEGEFRYSDGEWDVPLTLQAQYSEKLASGDCEQGLVHIYLHQLRKADAKIRIVRLGKLETVNAHLNTFDEFVEKVKSLGS